jgi:hypothetical protein
MQTPFRKEIEKKFEDKKLSPNSIKLYIRNLEKLNSDEPLKNLNFLKSPEEIMKKLEKYKDNTKRGYLISICSILSTDKGNKAKEKLYNDYFALLLDMNKYLKSEESKNEKSESQKKNWMPWDDVEKKRQELEDKVKSFSKTKELSENQYNSLLDLVIVSLYTLLPPRRNEYKDLILVKSIKGLNDTENYLDLDAKKFILNKFKTSKKEGQKQIEIPQQLMDIISIYLKHHPLLKGSRLTKTTHVHFLVFKDGKPLDKVNSITRVLNKVFGKHIGSSQLRHIYLSDKYGDIQEEQKKDSEMMSHSLGMQKDYIKVDKPEDKTDKKDKNK